MKEVCPKKVFHECIDTDILLGTLHICFPMIFQINIKCHSIHTFSNYLISTIRLLFQMNYYRNDPIVSQMCGKPFVENQDSSYF